MNHRSFRASVALLLLAGCTTDDGGPLGLVMFSKNHHVPGAGPLFAAGEDQCINGTFLLSVFSGKPSERPEAPACRTVRARIQNALGQRNIYVGGPEKPPAEAAYNRQFRNEVMDTFLWRSNDSCGAYVRFLQGYQANVRASTGILAQATAILATVVSPASTAKGFAAASGIAGGAGNTLYQAHFADQTVAVLVQAFDNARQRQLREIENLQQCQPNQYTLMRGMADVTRYHSTCSIVAGLAEASRAVEQSRAPTLESFNAFLDDLAKAQAKMRLVGEGSKDQTSVPETGAKGTTGGAGGGSGGTSGGTPGTASPPSGSMTGGGGAASSSAGPGSAPGAAATHCPYDPVAAPPPKETKPTGTTNKSTTVHRRRKRTGK